MKAALLFLLCTLPASASSISNGSSGTTTINGVACSLNGSCTVPTASPLFVQTNAVTDSTTGFVTLTGTGTGSTTLAANFFSAGTSIHILATGSGSSGATANNFIPTLQIFGVSFTQSSAGSMNNNVAGFYWYCDLVATDLTAGVAGTMLVRGRCGYGVAPNPAGTVLTLGFIAASQTVNTTTSTTVNLGMNFSAAGNTITCDQLQITPF